MRFFVLVLIIMLLSFLAGLWLPWWSVAAVPFILFLVIPQKPALGFFSTFIAIGMLWLLLGYRADILNDHILSQRMAELIFHSKTAALILVAGAFTGALPAGFAALTACLLRYEQKKKLTSFGRFYTKYL